MYVVVLENIEKLIKFHEIEAFIGICNENHEHFDLSSSLINTSTSLRVPHSVWKLMAELDDFSDA